MHLAITVLGNKADGFIAELLSAINSCHCSILEFCTSNLTEVTSAYVLVDGNWNHVAKLEGLLDSLSGRFQIQISLFRPPKTSAANLPEGVPYTLETTTK